MPNDITHQNHVVIEGAENKNNFQTFAENIWKCMECHNTDFCLKSAHIANL